MIKQTQKKNDEARQEMINSIKAMEKKLDIIIKKLEKN